MRICVLASGSSGNSTLVATERTRLLIDAGLSRREISRRLTKIGESADKLDAILISHEHTDHVSALRVLAAQHSLPVYISPSTRQALPWQAELRWEDFVPGSAFTVGDIEVTPFSIPHDAADPVAFTLRAEGLKVGLVTDLGYVPELVKQHVRGCQVLVLESNHDPELLKVSPYPWHVKQRVLSRNGHLSNLSTAQFLREDYDGEAQVLILGHLSQMNNLPELARMNAEEALQVRNGSRSPRLLVASQTEPTEMIQV